MKIDDFEENNGGMPVIYMALGVSVFILAVLGIVVAINRDNKRPEQNTDVVSNTVPTVFVDEVTSDVFTESNKLVASDLDIWDMYPNQKVTAMVSPKVTSRPKPTDEVLLSPSPMPDYDDGEHVRIDFADGSYEWVAINEDWPKNTYDFTNLVDSGGKRRLVSDGKTISFVGIDISRYQKEIDFNQIKDQGIEFVMIRVGARGYKTGALTLDEYFEDNINKAIEAGLDVGLYFFSQAITPQEAVDEANMVINAIGERKISYPIAFDMEMLDNDDSRIDTLTKDERTVIAAAFVNRIKEAGFRPMIYGDKQWLLKRIDVSKFTQSSIWLAQYDEIPDYPYTYDMWQYTTDGQLYGIDGYVDMNLCFVDYNAQ